MSHAPELVIAIDGPSGAGKGTVARAVAARLKARHIDTGAMYRAVAWKARRDGLDLADDLQVAALAGQAQFDLEGRVAIDGHDVTAVIRTPDIDGAAAIVARHSRVREVLVGRQRAYGASGRLIMEGRDIGTVVFPDADVKIYLDATPEERARRRAHDPHHEMGQGQTRIEAVAHALEARDRSDRTRAVSPLALASDAVYIDTTGVPIEEVIGRVLAVVDEVMARR